MSSTEVKPSSVGMAAGRDLEGKVALVTGGARNIGRAISRSLAAGGAKVMINARTSRDDAEITLALIKKAGGDAAIHYADVTDPDAVAAMVDATVKRFGRLDILVNNAAVRMEARFADIKLSDWQHVIRTVLDGTFLCSQAVLPHLVRGGVGAIINIGGQSGHKGARERVHVIAAKAGLAGMTKAMAIDLAGDGITVNCVVPGSIDTMRGLPGAPNRSEERKAIPPIGRRGEPEELAAMVRMLCGPDSRFVTGQAIHVNGGGYLP